MKTQAPFRYSFIITVLTIIISLQMFSQDWVKIKMNFSSGDTIIPTFQADFANKNIGWIIHDAQRKISKTTDGGYNWILEENNSNRKWYLFVVDSNNVYMKKDYHWISYTKDGGETWDSTYVQSSHTGGGLYFFNSDEGYYFGMYLYYTSDGGKTWSIINKNDSLVIISSMQVDFIDRNHGWVGGGHPSVID